MATATNGPDFIVLDSQDNYFDALAGDDIVFGESGNDTLHGGKDNDLLYGRDGNDKLYGDEGNDVLGAFAHWDDPGDDELYGGISTIPLPK